jgi:hypothetical protein
MPSEDSDMNKLFGLIGAASTALVAGSAVVAQNTAHTFNFGATLSGAQEPVPAEAPSTPSPGVSTQATGAMEMDVLPDLSSLTFSLNVQNLASALAAHLHCGRPGENGPIVATLFAPSPQPHNVSGVLASGTIGNMNIDPTASQCEEFIGRPVRDVASLTAAATLALIYVNVETVANPNGEIRGVLIVGVKPLVAAPVPAPPQ